MHRYLIFLVGIILALPLLVVISLVIGVPITISGIGYLLGWALAVAGLILFPWAGRRSLWLTTIGILGIASIIGARWLLIHQEAVAKIRMITLPHETDTLWINMLIDEEDSLIVGETLFHLIGGDSPNEHKGITSALHADYSEMKTIQSVFPSPILSTYLNLQMSTHFDAVRIDSEINHSPEFALIFLHGYMGNVAAQCWEISQALKNFDALTMCPSTDWRGDWWQIQGQAILEATFEYLRTQGVQKFYLAGFSNGGISIGRLAPRIKAENGIAGLIFIDGFDEGQNIRKLGLPVLILEGAQDERIPPAVAHQFAEEIGDLGTYREVEGDHFLIMKQPRLVQNAISTWMETHESK